MSIYCPTCEKSHRLMSVSAITAAAGGLMLVPLVGPDWDLLAVAADLDENGWVHVIAAGVTDNDTPILQVAAGANSESEAPRRLRAVLGAEVHVVRWPDGSVTRVWSHATGVMVVLVQ